MNNKPFLINNRFWVCPQLGTIKQINSEQETNIEPRLMYLLGILVMYNYEFVTSNQLAHQVWNYAGNDYTMLKEGIASLRKVLHDDANTIINAVPKKGYMLQAVVKFETDENKPAKQSTGNEKVYWVVAALLVAITVVYFILSGRH